MSYDPSQWYSYSKNRPNRVDEDKPLINYVPTKITGVEWQKVTEADVGEKQKELKVVENEAPKSNEGFVDTTDPIMVDTKQMQNKKFNDFVKRLQKMARDMPSHYKKKMTYDLLTQIAQSLLDDTVFEIVKGLEDIQQLSERNLLNKRMKMLTEHKTQRLEMTKRHQSAIQDCQSRPHQMKLIERENSEEKKLLEEKLEKELNNLDQKLVLEIDQQVIDQQATLQRAGVPLFFITNKPEDVQLQMYLLDFISRLIPDSCRKK